MQERFSLGGVSLVSAPYPANLAVTSLIVEGGFAGSRHGGSSFSSGSIYRLTLLTIRYEYSDIAVASILGQGTTKPVSMAISCRRGRRGGACKGAEGSGRGADEWGSIT
jgi:hypothetical protein